MDNKVLICYPQIKNVQTASCNYPIDLEMQMRTAICSDDQAREQELMKEN